MGSTQGRRTREKGLYQRHGRRGVVPAGFAARSEAPGFDWPDAEGPKAKVAEEIGEIEQAAPTDLEEEFGDLLFAVVNWARKSGVDPEKALRSANAKFERRFRAMERAEDEDFASLNLEAQEALWQQVKCEESSQNEE